MKASASQLKELKSLLYDTQNPRGEEIIIPLYGKTDTGAAEFLNDLFNAAIRSQEMFQIGVMRNGHFIDDPETKEETDRPVYARLGE